MHLMNAKSPIAVNCFKSSFIRPNNPLLVSANFAILSKGCIIGCLLLLVLKRKV